MDQGRRDQPAGEVSGPPSAVRDAAADMFQPDRPGAVNAAPVVQAGPNQMSRGINAPVVLAGSVTDDGLPANRLVIAWSKASGPGIATFADASSPTTTVTFSAPGGYALRLSASDGVLSAISETTITVLGLDFALLGYWPFDEGAGTVAKDLSNSGNDGQLMGDASWAPGRFNSAVDFSKGMDGSVLVPDPTTGRLDFGVDDFSISLWFQTAEVLAPADFLRLVGKQDSIEATRTGYEIYLTSANPPPAHVTFRIWRNGVNAYVFAGSGLADGKWHHVVARKTATLLEIFVDGRKTTAPHGITGGLGTAAPLEFCGHLGSPNSDYDGMLDEVRLYRRALTDTEVMALFMP